MAIKILDENKYVRIQSYHVDDSKLLLRVLEYSSVEQRELEKLRNSLDIESRLLNAENDIKNVSDLITSVLQELGLSSDEVSMDNEILLSKYPKVHALKIEYDRKYYSYIYYFQYYYNFISIVERKVVDFEWLAKYNLEESQILLQNPVVTEYCYPLDSEMLINNIEEAYNFFKTKINTQYQNI